MQSIKAKAFSLLAKRSYFAKELGAKLREKGYPDTDIESLIEELKSQNWLNDLELAERFVRKQREKGYSSRVILMKLREKAGSIAVVIEDDQEKLEGFIRHKYLKKLPHDKDKVMQALLRRGFSYDLIKNALNTILLSQDA